MGKTTETWTQTTETETTNNQCEPSAKIWSSKFRGPVTKAPDFTRCHDGDAAHGAPSKNTKATAEQQSTERPNKQKI